MIDVSDLIARLDRALEQLEQDMRSSECHGWLVGLICAAGAKEIHIRVSSPPIRFPCFYGMDFPSFEELIANKKSIDQTRRYLGVDTLGHLSIAGLKKAVEKESGNYCYACFSGKYPLGSSGRTTKLVFEKRKKKR